MNSKEYELFVEGQINYLCSKLEELYSEIGMNIGYSDKPTVSLYKNKDEVRELVSTHVRSSYQLVQQVETFDVTLDSNPSLDDLIIYDGKVSVGGIRQSISELGLEFYLIKKVNIMAENKLTLSTDNMLVCDSVENYFDVIYSGVNADVQMEKNMSKQHITVDVIIDLLERNKDVINAQLEGAGESASIQLDVEVKPRLPLVQAEQVTAVFHLYHKHGHWKLS